MKTDMPLYAPESHANGFRGVSGTRTLGNAAGSFPRSDTVRKKVWKKGLCDVGQTANVVGVRKSGTKGTGMRKLKVGDTVKNVYTKREGLVTHVWPSGKVDVKMSNGVRFGGDAKAYEFVHNIEDLREEFGEKFSDGDNVEVTNPNTGVSVRGMVINSFTGRIGQAETVIRAFEDLTDEDRNRLVGMCWESAREVIFFITVGDEVTPYAHCPYCDGVFYGDGDPIKHHVDYCDSAPNV